MAADWTEDDHVKWAQLYGELKCLMLAFGRESYDDTGHYSIRDDDWANYQHRIDIHNFDVLSEELVRNVQSILAARYPGWEVEIAITPDSAPATWRPMGVLVSASEIKDALIREQLPPNLQHLRF